MPRYAFLDAGVMLGFCFITDDHHKPCRNYLDDGLDYFIGDWRDRVFNRKKNDLTGRYSEGVRSHVADLTRSDLEGRLDFLDIRNIREDHLKVENEAHQFLYNYYDNVHEGITLSELQNKLRELAWDIESLALKRKIEFDSIVDIWKRVKDYPDVESGLAEIPNEDLGVCVDGHDLAVEKGSYTELATTDPKDFIYNGRRNLILSMTEIDKIVDLSI